MRKKHFLLSLLLLLMGVVNANAEVGVPLSKTGWTISASSACDENSTSGQIATAIDGNVNTYWHSSWGGYNASGEVNPGVTEANPNGLAGIPEYFILNLGEKKSIGGIGYRPRTDNGTTMNGNGALKDYKIYVSTEPFSTISTNAEGGSPTNEQKKAALELTDPMWEGTGLEWPNSNEKFWATAEAMEAQYIMVVFLNSYGDPANRYANCSEFNVYTYSQVDKRTLNEKLKEYEVKLGEAYGAVGDAIGYYSSATLQTAMGHLTDNDVNAYTIQSKADATEDEVNTAIKNAQKAIDAIQLNPIVTGYYKIVSTLETTNDAGETVTFSPAKYIYADGNNLLWKSINENDLSAYWQIDVDADNNIKVKNVAYGTYMSCAGNNACLTSTETNTTFKWIAGGQYNIIANGATYHASGHGSGAGVSGSIINWPSGVNSASSWGLEKVDALPSTNTVTIKYQVDYDGTWRDLYTYTANLSAGTTIYASYKSAEIPAFFKLGNTSSLEITEGNNEYVFPCVEDIPFKSSSSYETAVWQAIKAGDWGNYWQYNDDGSVATVASDRGTDKQLWAFVGNALDGYTIYNRAAGSSKTLSKEVGATEAKMTEGTSSKVKIYKNEWDTYKFVCLKIEGDTHYLYDSWNKIQGNESKGDGFQFFAPGDLVEIERLSGIENANASVVATYGSKMVGLPKYLSESEENFATFCTACPAVVADKYDVVNAQKLIPVANSEYLTFDASKYYRALNRNVENQWLAVNSSDKLNVETNNTTASTVLMFEPASEGFYIKLQDSYVGEIVEGTSWGTEIPLADAGGAKNNFAVEQTSFSPVLYLFKSLNCEDSKKYIHVGTNPYTRPVNYLGGTANNSSHWYLIEATSVDVALLEAAAGEAYATAYLPFDVTVPTDANVTAFVGDAYTAGDTYISMTEATEVKAENGFILKGTAAGDVTLTIGATEAAKESALSGTLTALAKSDSYLVLGMADGKVGFYGMGDGLTEIAANKAFLNNASGNAVRMLFPGNTTGIDAIENGQLTMDKAPIYDLSGRKVANPTKGGIYIKNGKKIIF